MVDFQPQTSPPIPGNPDLLQVSQWVERELQRLGQQLTNTDEVQYNVLYTAPPRPREGMTIVADGTRWNPGSGGGAYVYFGGAWVKLLTKTDTDALYLTQTQGDARYIQLSRQNPAFSAVKSATQTLAYNTNTLITFPATVYNRGSYFASNTWTPPAGLVSMSAACYSIPAGGTTQGAIIGIFKNAAAYKQNVGTGILGVNAGNITVTDVANGTDAYTVFFIALNSALGNEVVQSGGNITYFMGHWISP